MTEQEPATDKQVAFMKKLGVLQPETFSKIGARGAIELKLKEQEQSGDKPEVVSMNAPKVAQKAPVKEFHLSPEQVRTNALVAAIQMHGDELSDPKTMIDMAKKYENYIQNGN